MSEPVKPALSEEETPEGVIDWGERQVNSHYGFARTYLHVDHKGRIFAVSEMDGKRECCILNESYTDIPQKVAALCLYGQPFGFSREDVGFLREILMLSEADREMGELTEDEAHESQALTDQRRLRSLAARITALLPPEGL